MKLVKMEQEQAEKERQKEEDERKRKRELAKRRKRMLEASFDGDNDEINTILKEVKDTFNNYTYGHNILISWKMTNNKGDCNTTVLMTAQITCVLCFH